MEIEFLSRKKKQLDLLLNDVDDEMVKLNKYDFIPEIEEIAE